MTNRGLVGDPFRVGKFTPYTSLDSQFSLELNKTAQTPFDSQDLRPEKLIFLLFNAFLPSSFRPLGSC